MFNLFKKKPKEKLPPKLVDMDGVEINAGDEVEVLRYDLGKCCVELEGLRYYYVSLSTKDRVCYTKMIDAITGHQKVRVV